MPQSRRTLLIAAALSALALLLPAASTRAQSDAEIRAAPEEGAAPPRAPGAPSEAYEMCVSLASKNPESAREKAARWEAIGGGSEARHCGAIALIGLGAEQQAAEVLTRLGAEARDLEADDRAAALELAAELWLRLDKPQLARESYQRVIELRGGDQERWRAAVLGRARAAEAMDDIDAVFDDLQTVIEAIPEDAEALSLRAALYRRQGLYDRALKDAEAAVAAADGMALAWFEKGAAERSLGRLDAARDSWIQASLLDFEGPVGEMAQLNLQRMALDAADQE